MENSVDDVSVDQTNDESGLFETLSVSTNDEKQQQTWKKSLVIKPRDANAIKVFIVKKIDHEKSTEISSEMIKVLSTFKAEIFVEKECFDEFKSKEVESETSNLKEFSGEEESQIDFLIIVGGDGSILWALQYFQNSKVPPIISFSQGTLNYLCNFSTEGYENTLKMIMNNILNGNPMPVEERRRLQCDILDEKTKKKKTIHALNEIVLNRGCSPNVVRIDSFIEGKYFATFEGDGVLVATPTGSTAYQLSAGGPIMNHLDSSLAVTPMASMSMSTRSVVLPDSIKLSFKLKAGSRKNASLTADGQVQFDICPETEVLVTRSQHPISFILGDKNDTLDNWILRLRNLLGWNRQL